jgi:hypothetical protein
LLRIVDLGVDRFNDGPAWEKVDRLVANVVGVGEGRSVGCEFCPRGLLRLTHPTLEVLEVLEVLRSDFVWGSNFEDFGMVNWGWHFTEDDRMLQTISADKITLYDLEQRFGLVQSDEPDFFEEWQTDLPILTSVEIDRLVRVRTAYDNLARRSVLESTVKLAVVSPLLDLSGLFFPPFYVSTEEEVEVTVDSHDLVVRGRMDVLVLKEQFWVLVIESKRAELSLKVGIPQVLAYMLGAPKPERPVYGLVTNGSNFVFLKLEQQDGPTFDRSKEFVLETDHDLEMVLRIMKRLAERSR